MTKDGNDTANPVQNISTPKTKLTSASATAKSGLKVKYLASAADGAGHFVGMTKNGQIYTWGRSNDLGQLGRPGKARTPLPVTFLPSVHGSEKEQKDGATTSLSGVKAIQVYAGGTSDSGHSAVLDSSGYLWLTGCDRWQQLGLGSTNAAASGYTWKDGRLWQESFQRNDHLMKYIQENILGPQIDANDHGSATCKQKRNIIRDVALGGDHTVVLCSNRRDVITFGKGGEGQLGNSPSKPFVSTAARSKDLSLPKNSKVNNNSAKESQIAAVCAIRHCSLTLDSEGDIMKMVGKCKRSSESFQRSLQSCKDRAKRSALFDNK